MLDDISRAFQALGQPHRLAIIQRLQQQAACCCNARHEEDCTLDDACCNFSELAETLDIDKATVSHHLKELDRAGLIDRIRDGRKMYFRINRDRLRTLRQFLDVDRVVTPPAMDDELKLDIITP